MAIQEIPADWRPELAIRLKVARGSESQASLAARSCVSDRTISLIETEKLARPPRGRTVIQLAIATDSDPNEWLPFVGIPGRLKEEEIETMRNLLLGPSQDPSAEELRNLRLEVEELKERVAQLETSTNAATRTPFF